MKRTRLSIYDEFSNSRIDAMICEWIKSDRDRRILHHKLIDGWTYEHIAESEDLSTESIKSIIHKAENKLYKHLKFE